MVDQAATPKVLPQLLKMLKKNNPFIIIILAIFLIAASYLIYKFVLNQKLQLKEEKSGNINILILGRGGGTHDGPDLTDTIILAMVNPSKDSAGLISIPRDLWVDDIKGKINLAYALGQKQNNQGKLYAKAVVEKVAGVPIDYVVVIDFSGFVKLIDYLGGVDVNVSHTLDDYNYPVEGKEADTCDHSDQDIKDFTATASAEQDIWTYFPCRYVHLHVNAGLQHMDGNLALEFSRSRHGVGEEGSDFARSKRQQEVISAVKEKVLSLGIILNPVKIFGIFNILKSNIDTDIQANEYDDFINLARKMQNAKTQSYVIDSGNVYQGTFGLLSQPVPTSDKQFQFILSPRVGENDFSEIHDYVACITEGSVCTVGKEGITKVGETPTNGVK